MNFVNRWSGAYFGWIDDGELYTKDGRHVGRVKGREVYGVKGKYLGELRNHRLISNAAKADSRWIGFIPTICVIGPTVKPMNEEAFDLPVGFDDFPEPESL